MYNNNFSEKIQIAWKIISSFLELVNPLNKTIFILTICFFLNSCKEKLEDKIAKGGKKYGGEISFVETETVRSFFPLTSYGLHDQRLLSNLFEPLLKVDYKTQKITPNLAKNFSVSKDGKTIDLIIRKDVYFHKDNYNDFELEKMSVEDVKFSLEFACSGNKLNQLGHVLTKKIVGSTSFQKQSKNSFPSRGVSGIKIKNDSTITIELTNSFNNFTSLLSHPSIVVFSKKAYLHYKQKSRIHPVGTGPFQLESVDKNEIILTRNANYWKFDDFGNQLPFLEKIRILKPTISKNEQLLFSKGKTDILLQLPVDRLEFAFGTLKEAKDGRNLLHRILYRKGIKVNYLAFDCTSKPFNDERVRLAFYHAIDRENLWLNVLNGDGNIASKGFVPISDFYSDEKVYALKFDPQKAQKLLASAGYSNSNLFPKIDLYLPTNKGSLISLYYQELVRQIKKNLGIELQIKYTDFANRNRLIEQNKIKIWKAGWVSDYPDPESYLGVFYSGYKGVNNYTWNLYGFKNTKFDSLFYQSIIVKDLKTKMNLQNQCDQILVNKAAVVPLYTEDIFIIINIRARDIEVNSSGIIDFSKTYIKAPK
jgi:peptide/nickel transport system substrate-binding protein